VRDILKIARRRFPSVELVIRPVKVQGDGAAGEISQAILEFNQFKEVDVLIVGRGGGSLEDLWAFNEETVARAIYHSKIPIVSAVGHEIDSTIADFVADLRAPTPSAAAEMLVPERREVSQEVNGSMQRIVSAQAGLIELFRQRLKSAVESYGLRRPRDLILQNRQRLDELTRQMLSATQHMLHRAKQSFSSAAGRLNALSPLAILERGYSVCYRLPERQIVKSSRQLKIKDRIETLLWKGRVQSEVQSITPE